jgi:predicted oxidoreductase
VKREVKSMLFMLFDMKGVVHKEFALSGQRVNPHITVMYHGDCVKMCENFATDFGDKKN